MGRVTGLKHVNGFEKRTQEKKQQVLKAAFEMMNREGGVANITINQVAERAGVGRTTLFKYFENKEKLIDQVFEWFLIQMMIEADDIMAEEKSFTETVPRLAENKVKWLHRVSREFYLDMMTHLTQTLDGQPSLLNTQYTKNGVHMMLELFHRGRLEGQIDLKYSDEFLILYFQAMVEGISSPHIYDNILPYTKEWTEMLVKSVAPK